MKRIAIASLTAHFLVCSCGAASLTGMLHDGNKEAIYSARVTIWEPASRKGFQAVSDAGRFNFPEIPPGKYLIKIEKTGMATLYGALRLEGDNPHELNPVLTAESLGSDPLVKADPPDRKQFASEVSKQGREN